MEPLSPIHTAELFPGLHAALIALLRGLSEDDWHRPTIARAWRVRDVAGHLLDIDLRKLSGGRDRYRPSPARVLSSFVDVVDFINETNVTGVAYAGRLSTGVMIDLLEVTGRWVSSYVASLDPDEPAYIPVLWAGEDRSANWMDTGREYTERWHHQMQIRDAAGAPGLFERQWFYPLLDLSVRAFPRAYRDVAAAVGTTIVFEVDGDAATVWSLTREHREWQVTRGRPARATATIRTDPDTAWKLLYNALSVDEARARVAISGDRSAAEPMFSARSVMV
jgi:Mycothiol maleylpyruvate isomerase N-terminal domain